MTNKFEVMYKEFNLLPKNMRAFKQFISEVPDTASYKLEKRSDGLFFNTYWINVNPEPKEDFMYEISLPHICVYGKRAFDLINDLNPQDGIPFRIKATDTIELSRGFIDILVRKIKNIQAPYILIEGWVKEHYALLEEVSDKYKVVIYIAE